jgi:hypothetical protein
VPETREIAATFEAAGLTPLTMQGAAELYEAIALTEAGRESPEEGRKRGRSGMEVISSLDSDMPKKRTKS